MRIANKYNIIDKPNQRSSHTTPIILGGGVVFPIVLVFGSRFLHLGDNWFILGLFLVSLISFIDDRKPLPT
jgi:UDP-GlcNAc:undecaprenyl-phosphate/decaprenyl-phosphate GlcNAc-1-phosphate transferase